MWDTECELMQCNSEETVRPEETTSEQRYLELIKRKYNSSDAFEILDKIEWDFKDFNTQYLTHKFHSYPARFIPQIPLTFIKLFSKEKETIADPTIPNSCTTCHRHKDADLQKLQETYDLLTQRPKPVGQLINPVSYR